MPALKDLTGQKFGRLTVLERCEDIDHHAGWLCRCECGNITKVKGTYLVNANTRSCGCLHTDQLRKRSITHNMSKTRLYRIWRNMLSRCYNPKVKCYPYYGGQGVKISPEWNDFETFSEWAYQHGYSENLTIDRIRCDGDYSPDNCRWATVKEQNNNRRKRGTALNGISKFTY